MIKVLLFDFDGTIANSFEVAEKIFYEITGQDRFDDPAEIDRLRKMPVIKAIKELHIKPWQVPVMLMKGKAAMAEHIDEVPVFPGIVQTIRALHKAGYQMYIMSSNSAPNVQHFLKKNDLSTYFIRVYGNIGLLHKAAAIRNVTRRNHLSPQECAYIGDEVRDIEGAKKAGVFMISVPWGYNDEHLLAEHEPDVIVHEPKEILTILEQQNREQ